MADSHSDIPLLSLEEPDQPSRFMRSIVASPPSARRPQMINTSNPLNKAEAHPSAYISIDTNENQPPGKIGIRMADLGDKHSRSLTSTTSGRPHTYRARGVATPRRQANSKGAAKAGKVADMSSEAVLASPARLPHSFLPSGESERNHAQTNTEGGMMESKRGAEAKKVTAHPGSEEDSAQPSEKKHNNLAVGMNVATEVDTSKASDSSIVNKRDRGMRVPDSLEEACAADRMLWEWRNVGKSWAEITPKWIELTGKTPGKSSLGVRFMKLQANFAHAEGADVAAKIEAKHNIKMSIPRLRKRFRALKSSGFKIGTTLESSGADGEAEAGAGPSAVESGDFESGAIMRVQPRVVPVARRPVAVARCFSTSRKQLADHVRIVEVGPRDGLQNEKVSIPLSSKLELIRRLSQTGVTHLEAGSFVPAKWVPQMASTAEILQTLRAQPPPAPHGIAYNYLVPNIRGLQDLVKISLFAAATESFSRKNINCSIAESLERFRPVLELAKEHNIRVRGYLSVALGCPYEGPDVDPHKVAELTATLLEMGCDEVSVADTTGMGTAPKTRRLLQTLKEAGILNEDLALHFHDTYGQALVNTVVGLEHGVRTFDSSVGGLGGCPYSKGATGNVATEDLLHLLHSLGLETGIDMVQMAEVGQWITGELGKANESRAGKATLARLRSS
ncbi:hypothetical protein DV738_g3027, partial [Chaetothyriales sp. CBS 135597]